MSKIPSWRFIDGKGSFSLDNPDCCSHLYFPLANPAGMMSSITPTLGGDAKTGQSSFLLTPVSAEDLHTSRSTRNFWVYKEGEGAWSATGNSAAQTLLRHTGKETSRLEAGFLWQKVTRENDDIGLRAEVTSYAPCEEETVELTKIVIKNISDEDATLTPTAAVPIYGRSADNIRDHRHVTSLLQRAKVVDYGVELAPSLLFDEHGHSVNHNRYTVLGSDGQGNAPVGFFPDIERFVGEGGSLDWPRAVVSQLEPCAKPGDTVDGYEVLGGLRFKTVTLAPGEQACFVLALCINSEGIEQKYLSSEKFDRYLEESKAFWEQKLNIRFATGDSDYDNWMKWVSCEPILRRIYGCSFLPDHDYGRGGRGWRDLWQDCIALLIMEPENVGRMLYNNCAGIRFDGTNATIIGSKEGEFIADRNNIARVWMDHGAWPLNTVAFYINQSGDLDFLLKEQTYFKDKQCMRGRAVDGKWDEAQGTKLRTESGEICSGSILEHLLIENLAACLNVGEHGMLRLENADWNDALDMAPNLGESVAFTSMYCGNLRAMAGLMKKLKEAKGITSLSLASEIAILFEGIALGGKPDELQAKLKEYCRACEHRVSGEKQEFKIGKMIAALENKADHMAKAVVVQEQVKSEGHTWLNSYYDDAGEQVEGKKASGVRMMLTGQVFPIMFGVTDDELTSKIAQAADHYLYDESIGGYRLNTDFKELKTNLGRQFGFAYGHKENGAVFSHMTVMYANALYQRGFVKEGFKALGTLCRHSMDFAKSFTYPGIPEYFNSRGRGMYPYLTGAASWLMMTTVTEVFGIKGEYGDLLFSPKLLAEQFDKNGYAACETLFGGKRLSVIYQNKKHLDYGEYGITAIMLDGKPVEGTRLIADQLGALDGERLHTIEIVLEGEQK